MTECASEVVPVLLRASAMPATKRPTGVPLPSPRLHPCATGRAECPSAWLHHPPDRPNETRQLARDCGHGDIQLFAAARERPVARAETDLGLERDLPHRRWHTLVHVVLDLLILGTWR